MRVTATDLPRGCPLTRSPKRVYHVGGSGARVFRSDRTVGPRRFRTITKLGSASDTPLPTRGRQLRHHVEKSADGSTLLGDLVQVPLSVQGPRWVRPTLHQTGASQFLQRPPGR